MDKLEALRYSGKKDLDSAFDYFVKTEVNTFIITNGEKSIWAYSNGEIFEEVDKLKLPVSDAIL